MVQQRKDADLCSTPSQDTRQEHAGKVKSAGSQSCEEPPVHLGSHRCSCSQIGMTSGYSRSLTHPNRSG